MTAFYIIDTGIRRIPVQTREFTSSRENALILRHSESHRSLCICYDNHLLVDESENDRSKDNGSQGKSNRLAAFDAILPNLSGKFFRITRADSSARKTVKEPTAC